MGLSRPLLLDDRRRWRQEVEKGGSTSMHVCRRKQVETGEVLIYHTLSTLYFLKIEFWEGVKRRCHKGVMSAQVFNHHSCLPEEVATWPQNRHGGEGAIERHPCMFQNVVGVQSPACALLSPP